MNHNIHISIPNITEKLIINLNNNNFQFGEIKEVVRFLKMAFRDKKSFESDFIEKIKSVKQYNTTEFCNEISQQYDIVTPYSVEEAFKITDERYRIFVFSLINITEMIENLGAKRICTDGKTSTQKRYNSNGEYIETIEMSNIYEVYEVLGDKLGLNSNVYALKCWCTTTNGEHWIWIDEKYKDNPLEAIASTFLIHENIIPYIKELKRQGDILFVEMKKGSEHIKPKGAVVSLTAEKYFKLLTTQS